MQKETRSVRSLLAASVLTFAAAAMLAATPFWVEKPYSDWNEKEVTKILSDSPWVRPADINFDFSAMRGNARASGPGGAGSRAGGGSGTPGSDGRMGAGMSQINATVMWRSALPVRQAMYQAAVLKKSPSAEALERAIAEVPAYHILAVNGLPNFGGRGQRRPGMPPPDGGVRGTEGAGVESERGPAGPRQGQPPMSPEQREQMRKQMEERQLAATKLIIGDQVINAERMENVQLGESRIVLFYFPKSREVDSADKEAKFETQLGPLKLSAKFKPREMILAGDRMN